MKLDLTTLTLNELRQLQIEASKAEQFLILSKRNETEHFYNTLVFPYLCSLKEETLIKEAVKILETCLDATVKSRSYLKK